MKIRLLVVGKPRDRELALLHDRYAERIVRLGAEYDTAWVPETQQGGRYSDAHVKEREARALLDQLDPRGTVVALDPGGRMIDSVQLAGRLEGWAHPRLQLVIGGPLGLHRDVLERAAWCWSMSALTFPHELVRVLVAEQIYRALSILRNLPYHK